MLLITNTNITQTYISRVETSLRYRGEKRQGNDEACEIKGGNAEDQQSTVDLPRLSAAGAERSTISHGSVGLSVHICPSVLQSCALPQHRCTLSSPKFTSRGLNHMIICTAMISTRLRKSAVSLRATTHEHDIKQMAKYETGEAH